MKPIEDGGSAFPRPHSESNRDHQDAFPAESGISTRDYFAAKAMQALTWAKSEEFKMIARAAYELADAMIAERDRVPIPTPAGTAAVHP